MSDEQDRGPGFRRFRMARRVKPVATAEDPAHHGQSGADAAPLAPIPETYAQQALREAVADDATKGTPEMDRAVSKGCMGCLRVALLFFIIMLASIFATWCIRRPGV